MSRYFKCSNGTTSRADLDRSEPMTSLTIRMPPPKVWSVTLDQAPFATPIKATRLHHRQLRRPMSNRLANERLVTDPRRAVILVDLAATLAILPVPIITPYFGAPWSCFSVRLVR